MNEASERFHEPPNPSPASGGDDGSTTLPPPGRRECTLAIFAEIPSNWHAIALYWCAHALVATVPSNWDVNGTLFVRWRASRQERCRNQSRAEAALAICISAARTSSPSDRVGKIESSALLRQSVGGVWAAPTIAVVAEPDVAVDFDPSAYPKKLNLGCGFDHRDGYLNIDFHPDHTPDLLADVRSLPMLPDGYYEEVLAQDILEHLVRVDMAPTLAEWARIIAIGGTLIVRVPDIIGIAQLMAEEHSVERQEQMVHVLYGTQAYEGDYHMNGFTELSLRHALHEAGFVTRTLDRQLGWLFDCSAERVGDPGEFSPGTLPFMGLGDAQPAAANLSDHLLTRIRQRLSS